MSRKVSKQSGLSWLIIGPIRTCLCSLCNIGAGIRCREEILVSVETKESLPLSLLASFAVYDLITLLSSCQNGRERRRSSLLVCVYNCTSLSSLYTYVNADCRLFAVLFVYSVYCTSSGYLVGLLYAMTSRFPFPSLLEITQCQFLTFF